MLILILAIIYVLSLCKLCNIYNEIYMSESNLWAWIILLTPIINTIFCIKYWNKSSFNITYSYKNFIKYFKQ